MSSRNMKPPGGDCQDLFGASFNGSPSHLRVLKPPGGGSSDIFGAPDPQEPRKARAQPQQSSLFLSHDEPAPVKSRAGNETVPSDHFFGKTEVEPRFSSAAKNKDRYKSNIVLGGDDTPPAVKQILTSSQKSVKEDTVLAQALPDIGIGSSGDGPTPTSTEREKSELKENPEEIDANGYHKPEPTISEPPQPQQPIENGVTSVPTQSAAAPRQRVPPGGFSKGLW